MTDPTRAKQIQVIQELSGYDHNFISKDGVAYFTEPFGFKGTTVVVQDTSHLPKGLTLPNGMKEAEGQDASEVAAEICRHLGIDDGGWIVGRGSKLRICCSVLLDHLGASQ